MSKLTEKELEELNKFNSNYNSILTTIGAIEVKKNKLFFEHQDIQEKFQKFVSELKNKYGDGIIDLETGEIKPEEDK